MDLHLLIDANRLMFGTEQGARPI